MNKNITKEKNIILSIDSATKTFGYILSEINVNYISEIIKEIHTYKNRLTEINNNINKIINDNIVHNNSINNNIVNNKINDNIVNNNINDNIVNNNISINDNINNLIKIIDCDVIDLLDKKTIKEVNMQYIIHQVKILLDKIIFNLLKCKNLNQIEDIKDKIIIILENQWGINMHSNVISSSIMMFFIKSGINKDNIYILNPTLKNKVHFNKAISYENIKLKYPGKTNYIRTKCRKQHTIENMIYYFDNFKMSDNLKHIKQNKYEHIADAFMQLYIFIMQL
jgi:hypothetical protein